MKINSCQLASSFRITVRVIAFFLAPLCSSNVFAQASAPHSPHGDAFVREKVSQHTIRVSSNEDSGIIPSHIYYDLIFKEILSNPEIRGLLPDSDWEIIRDLPSRFDKQFVQVDLIELSEICAMERDKAIVDMDVASAFDVSRKRSERALDTHYSKVVSSLSENTRKYVESRKRELGNGAQIGYSVLEMSSLEADAPGISRELISRRCPDLVKNLEAFSPVTRTLQDELTSAYPIEASR